MRRACRRFGMVALLALATAQAAAADSVCRGTVAHGRLEHGVKLAPGTGNVRAYSALAAAAGRTHVHARVARVVQAAYARLATTRPDTVYVYGETGLASGGRFRPHRTHQNGTSVDFFVPVRDAEGRSVPLPTGITSRFGYDLEFDAAGRHGELRIDFDAIAEHLHELDAAARENGSGLALVIVDPRYLPLLFATPRGASLRGLPFMKGTPWVRHDEHYHVDFAVRCQPLAG